MLKGLLQPQDHYIKAVRYAQANNLVLPSLWLSGPTDAHWTEDLNVVYLGGRISLRVSMICNTIECVQLVICCETVEAISKVLIC